MAAEELEGGCALDVVSLDGFLFHSTLHAHMSMFGRINMGWRPYAYCTPISSRLHSTRSRERGYGMGV